MKAERLVSAKVWQISSQNSRSRSSSDQPLVPLNKPRVLSLYQGGQAGLRYLIHTHSQVQSRFDDLDQEEVWPPYQTPKQVRRLSNHELAEITAWEQVFFDMYVRNDIPDDPVTREFLGNLKRLNKEIDRRIEAGTLREEDLGLDYVPELPGPSRKSTKKPSRVDALLNYGIPICGLIGSILGLFFYSTPGIVGALYGAFLGAFVPIFLLSAALMFGG